MDFWKIYDQYYERVKKFIRSVVKDEWVAEDLIQETFIKVQKNLAALEDPSKLSAWIFRIAYNLCQDHFRSKKNTVQSDQTPLEKIGLTTELPFQKQLEQHQMSACVQDKIDRFLPEPLRIVLTLYDLMEFTHQEIADVLDISVENAKVRLHRARKKLKDVLKVECHLEHDERNVLVCEPVVVRNRTLD